MAKIQRYVVAEVMKAFLPAFVALTLLMVVGFCMQLLRDGLDIVRLPALLPPVFAHCVPMVLPAAFLTAVIMTFGRLSADNELLAMRTAGIHLWSIIHPILAVGVGLSVVAAYLHFEAVPRAGANVRRLKYRALQQVLVDRAALSASRRFSLSDAQILYDDFRDGQMEGVVVLRVADRRPVTVITGQTATVAPDLSAPDQVIRFVLSKCVITPLGASEYGTAGTATAERVTLSIATGPDDDWDRADAKYAGTVALMRRLAELQGQVAARARLDNPEKTSQELRTSLRARERELAECRKALEAARAKYVRYSVEEPLRLRQFIESGTRRKGELQEQAERLRAQQAEYQSQILRYSERASEYERLDELLKRNALLKRQIEESDQAISEVQSQIDQATERLADCERRALKLKQDVEALGALKDRLAARVAEIGGRLRSAEQQKQLLDIQVRIHRRLAQAVSVLAFALVGIPLGIVTGGRNVMVAFGASFGVVLLVFYPLLILGEMLAEAQKVSPAAGLWAANAVVAVFGAVLMIRAFRT